MIIEKYFCEDINENFLFKMVFVFVDKGYKGKFIYDKKCDFIEIEGKKEDIDLVFVDNYFNEDKRKGNEYYFVINLNNML